MIKEKLNKFLKGANTMAQAENTNVEALVAEATKQLSTELESAQALLATQIASFAELQASYNEVVAELASVKSAKAAMEKAAIDAKFAARKEKIVAAVGTGKADALFSATESLDDASFDAVVGSMVTSLDNEAMSAAFQEQGVSHAADASKVAEEGNTMEALIKAKYAPK